MAGGKKRKKKLSTNKSSAKKIQNLEELFKTLEERDEKR